MSANLQCESDYFGGVLSFQLDHAHPKGLARLTVEPYVEWLYLVKKFGGMVPTQRAGTGYGVYRRAMEAWGNSEALADAVFEMCEFHCEAMTHYDEGHDEFEYS